MPARASSGAIVAGIGLSLLVFLLWAVQLATLTDLSGSDPAGNGLAQAFGALEIIILWVLLAVLTILAGVKGEMPWPAARASVLDALQKSVRIGRYSISYKIIPPKSYCNSKELQAVLRRIGTYDL